MRSTLGYVPNWLGKVGSLWTASMPAYAPPFIANPLVGYLVAAVLGSALVIGVAWAVGKLLSRKDGGPEPTDPPAASA